MQQSDITLSEKVNAVVDENQHLRTRCESQETTIELMREQYEALAGQVDSIRNRARIDVERARGKAEAEVTDMMIERDRAIRAYVEIDGLLRQTGELISSAFRARAGNETPEQVPERRLAVVDDSRLPAASIS